MSTCNPIGELGRFLTGWAIIAKAKRQFSELLGVQATQEIANDIVAHEAAVCASAHKSETYDREALRLLDEVMADGVVTPAEINQLRKARKLTSLSAECDHNITEAVALS